MNRNARSLRRRPADRGRALLALAALFAVGGVVLGVLSFRSGPDPEAAVLDVDDALTATLPSTVPPRATLPPAAASTTAPPSMDVDVATTTVPDTDVTDRMPASTQASTPTTAPTVSEVARLAALLGDRGSAIPPEIEPRVQPVGLRIGDIFVDDPVRPVGLEDDGQLEVPDADEIGWYRYGAAPGYPGATVLAAHVTWNGEYGPFLNLGDLDLGETVIITLEDGSTRTYEVVERTMYDKDGLPRERIWRTTGDETLVLITCGGDFNPDINRYRQNIVVYAVPIG